jgi:hypothetical protein
MSFGGAAFAAWLTDRGLFALPAIHVDVEDTRRHPSASRVEHRLPDSAPAALALPEPASTPVIEPEPQDLDPSARSAPPVVTRRAHRPRPSGPSLTERGPAARSSGEAQSGEGTGAPRVTGEPVIERPTIRPDPILAPSSETAQPALPATLEDGAENVALAMERLRAQHDPSGALQLLSVYRRLHPTGMLSEEALALSIEAAAQIDPPRAHSLAKEYLARFPSGRFRALAAAASGGD